MMQKSTIFTTIFRVKKCSFHYDFRVKKCHFHYDMQKIAFCIFVDRKTSCNVFTSKYKQDFS
jgi:hypothetical protein